MLKKDDKYALIKNVLISFEDNQIKLEIEDSYDSNRRIRIERIAHEIALYYFEREKISLREEKELFEKTKKNTLTK